MDRNEIDGRMSRMDAAIARPNGGGTIDWKPGDPVPDITGGGCTIVGGAAVRVFCPGTVFKSTAERCAEIADTVVPEYRSGNYSCSGHWAKRWSAAYDGARVALGGEKETT